MRNKSNSKRTEATLSLLVTSALVITLAIAVASAIKKGDVNQEQNNIVNLNETEAPSLSADNNTTKSNEAETETSEITKTDSVKRNTVSAEDTRTDESSEELSDNLTAEENADSDIPVALPDSINTEFSFSEADTLMMPVSGEIILPYNMDNTIWFPTLSVYKCNPGLYISGEVGTEVAASATGRVTSITQNEELGNIVTLDMGNGYAASYGQLENIQVSEGEVVLAGSTIGTVAQPTIYYTTEGSGVYFKLTKDNTPANPLDYME